MNVPRQKRGRGRKTVDRRVGKTTQAGAIASAIAVTVGWGWMALMLAVSLVPLPEALRGDAKPEQTSVVVDAEGGTLAWLPGGEQRLSWPVELEKMGEWLPEVAVALEDHRFAGHRGVDPVSLAGAVRRNVAAGKIVSGASTVSQQLIKLAVGPQRAGLAGKNLRSPGGDENSSGCWSKQQILTQYLNRSVYGNRIVGPEAAARVYFGKKCSDLSLAEAVFLAGLPQAPTRFNPWSRPDSARARYLRCLDRLVAVNFLTKEEADRCSDFPPLVRNEMAAVKAPHFVDYVRQLSVSDGKESAAVLRTTLDPVLQRQAEEILRQHLRSLPRRDVQHGAVVVIDNRSGAVRAMVGSPDYDGGEGQNNGALIYRSCGSTLKPFLYLKAIADGKLTAASLLPDTATATRGVYADYSPENYDSHHWGPVRVRVALASSLNVPAVMALSKVGAREMYTTLEDWGFRFRRKFDDYGAGMILGNAEIRLIDLAAGFAALARGGTRVPPAFLRGDSDEIGNRSGVRFLADPQAVAIVTDILCDNEARRRTFGGRSPLATEERCAVKTGTSSGFRDTWTVGFSADHTVGVWVGNFDGRPMQEISSINGAAPVWRAVMDLLLENDAAVPRAQQIAGGRLVERKVCQLTGLQPGDQSPAVVSEFFLPGTEPQSDAASMLRDVDDELRLVLPVEYAAWCASDDNRMGAIVDPDAALRIIHPAPGAVFFSRSTTAARAAGDPLAGFGGRWCRGARMANRWRSRSA